ncbi:MAG: hypothetical protein AAF420_06850 [Pseudomonadota bacterium]
MFKSLVMPLVGLAVFATSTVDATLLRDPTRPDSTTVTATKNKTEKVKQAPPPVELVLSAIASNRDGGERRAIINGVWVDKGTRIEGALVLRVHRTSVELRRNGKPVTLNLISDVKLKPNS